MSQKDSPAPEPAGTDRLNDHLTQFLAALATAGYAEKTQHDKRRLIVPFIRWLRNTQPAVADLDEACVGVFLTRPSRRFFKHGNPERTALHQFLRHFRSAGAAPPHHPSGLCHRPPYGSHL